METLNVCPSTLAEGFDTYSPTARKLLFNGKVLSHRGVQLSDIERRCPSEELLTDEPRQWRISFDASL